MPISVQGVGRSFVRPDGSHFPALQNVSLDVSAGRFVCLVGPSGCGKSTLLNMIAGLIVPTSGTVLYGGKPLVGVNSAVGYITQNDTLLPWRTVRGNVGLALEIRDRGSRHEQRTRVDAVLKRVGLFAFAEHYPSQLSGGMRRRAILARSLIYEPKTLLLDEPFGALDAQMRLDLQQHLIQLWEQDRRTVIFVTHDLEEALLLADDIVVFAGDPGRIVHIEQVEFARPRDALELRMSPEFARRWRSLWDLISPGAAAASAEQVR